MCVCVCARARYLCHGQHTEHGRVQWVDALQLHAHFKTSSPTGERLGLERENPHMIQKNWNIQTVDQDSSVCVCVCVCVCVLPV